MKMLSLLAGMLIIFASAISPTSLNGRFIVLNADNSKLIVQLQINSSTGADDLGGSTIVLGFDKNVLGFNSNPIQGTDYNFSNFSGGNYSTGKVTRPMSDKVWINIDLPYSQCNKGTIVPGTNQWINVVTLHFDLIKAQDTIKINWLSNNPFWGVYDGDNKTLWNSGVMENLVLIPGTDFNPPKINNAVLIDSENLELTFSEVLESNTALNKANYSINNGISILSVSQNQNIIRLQTSAHTYGQNYLLTVQKVTDFANNLISSSGNSIQYKCTFDNVSPDITSITATNNKSVTVKFSEKLDPNTAKNKNNYKISNSITINQVQLQPDSTSVLLKTSQHQSNTDYVLEVTEIRDQSGNLISPNPKTINYRISSNSKGGKVKNTVSYATATSWEENYTVEKTVDGYGMNTPDSRWQSARFMPDTLTYDFGENVALDSLRISFYKGESGRLFKYSVYSSKDSKEWKPVVDDVWSEASEWTEVEFDSTRGRYVKLILKQSNQGVKASIWEFEAYGVQTKESQISNGSPNDFVLMQNYPNPFNPSTKVRFNLPSNVNGQMSNVILKVYDILGNEVATLVNEEKPAGSYEVEFNADNLSSGVYIYRIQTADYTDTKKMILLR
jgi:hypothetical protein